MNRALHLLLAALCCLLPLCGCAQAQVLPSMPAPVEEASRLEVTFFNCGKADSALLRAGDNTILIDTGTQKAGKYVLSRLQEMGVTRLDAMIISHPHKDHVGGADVILEEIPASQVYVGPLKVESKQVDQFDEALEALGLTPVLLKAGDAFTLGGMTLRVLGPRYTDYEDENDRSLVLQVAYGDTKFLFAGDAEKPLLNELLTSGSALQADVLKVPHHGRAEDNSPLFFQAVSPQIAVIPCERGTEDGLPEAPVVSALKAAGAGVYVTDDGDVTVLSDGKKVTARQGTAP